MAKETSFQRGKHRFYPCPQCGEDHPSVTTLLDMISNPALNFWLAKNGTQKLNHFAKIVENYTEKELYEKASKEAEETWIKAEGTAFWKSGKQAGQEAADVGTITHATIEAHLQGKEIDLRSLPDKVINSFKSYLKWEKEHKVKVIETEKTFYGCEFNTAGTADFVGYIDDELTIMDHKTSTGIYLSMIIQAWCYALCDEATSDRLYKQVTIGRWAKDGTSEFKIFKRNEFPTIEDARKIILACGEIFRVNQTWERLNPYKPKEKKL